MTDQHTYTITDTPKMLRETLCIAQSGIAVRDMDLNRQREHMMRIQRLIDECDRKRPLGTGGKHGDLHTAECGCT